MNFALATNYSDPVKRLTKINGDSRSSKTMASSVKDVAPNDFTILGAPMLLPGLMQLLGKTGLADIAPNPVNVTISNTMGPPVPLYCAGAKVTSLYPVSIPVHGVGLNFTVQSYMGQLDFGVTADAKSVPDADLVGDLLVYAFDELYEAVLGEREKTEAAPVAKPTTKKPAARKSTVKPAAKAATKTTTKVATKTAPKTARKTTAKAAAKPAAKPRATRAKADSKPAADG